MDVGQEALLSAWKHIHAYPVCNLATIDSGGKSDNRVMGYIPLLMDERVGLKGGIVFVMNTDTGTRKTHQLEKNLNVSITVGQEWPSPSQSAPYARLKGRAKVTTNTG